MKELFWIGVKGGSEFTNQKDLQTAISDINSIGWEIYHLNEEVLESDFYRPKWDAYGLVIYKNEICKIMLSNTIDVKKRVIRNPLLAPNPNCGIYVYEVKPKIDDLNTVPKGSYLKQEIQSFQIQPSLIIGNNIYFISPSKGDVNDNDIDPPDINVEFNLSEDVTETTRTDKIAQIAKDKKINERFEKIDINLNKINSTGLIANYMIIALIVVLLIWVIYIGYQMRKNNKDLNDKIANLQSRFNVIY